MVFLFTIPSEKEPLGRNMVVFCQIIFLIPNKEKNKKIFREIDMKFVY